jgi:hypothetical protein
MPSKKKDEIVEKWYYDANSLDDGKGVYGEILNKHPKKTIISHLAIGEAYGNCLGDGKEKSEAFIRLMDSLMKIKDRKIIQIVGNDGINVQLDKVREKMDRLSITDAIHLATALKHGCCMFKTSDRDLKGLNDPLVKEVCEDCGVGLISIKDMF